MLGLKTQDVGIELPKIPKEFKHNAHIFYIKCKSLDERERVLRLVKVE